MFDFSLSCWWFLLSSLFDCFSIVAAILIQARKKWPGFACLVRIHSKLGLNASTSPWMLCVPKMWRPSKAHRGMTPPLASLVKSNGTVICLASAHPNCVFDNSIAATIALIHTKFVSLPNSSYAKLKAVIVFISQPSMRLNNNYKSRRLFACQSKAVWGIWIGNLFFRISQSNGILCVCCIFLLRSFCCFVAVIRDIMMEWHIRWHWKWQGE